MIKVYCQYSYGGFKTFYIEGLENEPMEKEVIDDTVYDFPEDAYCYFQYGGAKMVYRQLKDGRYDLVVREIPSLNTDGDGRQIPCAVQFVGDAEDKQTLDHLAQDIAHDMLSFENFFAYLFRIRKGLRIDGNKLYEFIKKHSNGGDYGTEIPQLQNVSSIKNGVMLFVPLSEKFGVDKFVTENVCNELGLNYKELKHANCVIRNSELIKLQKHEEEPEDGELPTVTPIDNPNEDPTEEVNLLKKQLSDLENEKKALHEEAQQMKAKVEALKQSNQQMKKYLLCTGVAALGFAVLSIVAFCSSCK